ncbi:MAG: purine-binding chemotaxis protein CheW, partial [Pseudoalteromonas distincta]
MSSDQSQLSNQLNLQQQQGVKQFLTFIMADEEYGVDILTVQEIRSWEEITVLPNAPEFVKGVINLRGTIVPIIDLRLRFGLPSVDYGPLTVVIVVKIEFELGSKIIGVAVDAVSDVYSIA